MRILLFSATMAIGLGGLESAAAQIYPSRPITMVVPFPAGAPVDMVGRIMAERMRVSLGQAIIIENVSGAAGSLGAGRSEPPTHFSTIC
jgi:tripartite-type tricarboxylate transporter receptor subunit TctC